jgi:dihydropyrimidine dehydrogenase (NADP+)
MGGVETAEDALQFMLVGASTVQVCTGAMLHGYGIIADLCRDLEAFLDARGLASPAELVGQSLPYFTTHADLVARQREARREQAGQSNRDGMWQGDIARETDTLVGD